MKNVKSIIAVASLGFALAACSGSAPQTSSGSTSDGSSRAVLRAQAEWLAQNASTSLVIEGHADERGTREYNLALGARRANAVRDFLISQGVDSARLETISFGKERPVSLCSEESCWSKNRRAVSTPR
jgi:peptidoglycan-associated lipoprotein